MISPFYGINPAHAENPYLFLYLFQDLNDVIMIYQFRGVIILEGEEHSYQFRHQEPYSIPSIPLPTAGNYSHMEGTTWMVDGEALAVTMAAISTPQGAGTTILDPEFRVRDGGGAP